MTREYDSPDDRMEALLRLWGAEQAALRQDLPPAPPVLKPVRLDLRYAMICAACVIAGAAVAIGAMLLARRAPKPQPSASKPVTSAAPAAEKSLSEPFDLLETRSAETQPHVVPAPERADSSIRDLRRQLAEMRRRRNEILTRLAEVEEQRDRQADEIAALREKLAQAEQMHQAVEQLNRDLRALRKEQDAALAMAGRLRKKLAQEGQEHRAKYQRMLEVYLAALAPDRQGLEAIQEAIRTGRLLPRCFALRQKAQTDEAKKLLDRVEATLIRLDFLDTNDVTAMVRFEHQLGRDDLLANVTATLLRDSDDRELQIFLAEVDLILSGVRRVG
ncbi:MAG: hypothetical protein JW849_10995 [Phycisphaerae bacterium]|nr:hypothetical protein [Phycisphaerae bacterium]